MTQNISGENQSQTGKEKCLVQIRLIATMAFVLVRSLPIVQKRRAVLRNIYGWQKAIKTKEMTKNPRC